MELIYANSLYVTIHFELFRLEEGEYPVYIELVHNTDDDSLILFLVDDVKDLSVKEARLDNLEDTNWYILKTRFGSSTESLLTNVETFFRTLEFFQIIKKLK